MIAVAHMAGKPAVPINKNRIPGATYTEPGIGSVGLTEAQARDRGYDVATTKLNLQVLAKANIVGEGGLAKVVAERDGGQVLGVHQVGPHVTELIAEASLIYNWEASASDVAAIIHPHPTLSEAVGEAMLSLAGKPLHTM